MAERTIPTEVLEKIEKIRNLRDNAGTMAEAEAAAAALQRILTTHQLDLIEVEARLGGITRSEFAKNRFDLGFQSGWRRWLIGKVARQNFGRMVWHPGSTSVSIVADKESLEAIITTYKWLETMVDRMARDACEDKRRSGDWLYLQSPRTWGNSYREGMVDGLGIAMRRAKAEAAADFSGGSALVVLKDAAVDEAYAEMFPNLSKGNYRNVGNYAAYAAGKQRGQAVSFGKPVQGGSRTAIG